MSSALRASSPARPYSTLAPAPAFLALTAARRGAKVTGLDLTPELIEQARENAAIARLPDIVWTEGDVEYLPYADASFDVVLSQFGHMFGPRPDVVMGEMRRVLKPGGRVAFADLATRALHRTHVRVRGTQLTAASTGCRAAAAVGQSGDRCRTPGRQILLRRSSSAES